MDIATYVCLAALFYAIYPASKATTDPCSPEGHKELLRGKYRGTWCPYNSDKPVCDRQIEAGWYKVQGLNGSLQMPEYLVGLDFCGTTIPIWMNGSHPTKNDSEVLRTACIPIGNSSCSSIVKIRIKNCEIFYVYYLTPTRSCPMAYCFGINETCPPFDPCDNEYENTELENKNGDRSSMCKTVEGPYCDSEIENGWHRIHSKNGYQSISSNCPEYSSCQTRNPIWINGSIPALKDGIVTRKACVRNETSCCSQSFDMQMKNCSTYIVYNLKKVECFQRYCTDEKIECPVLTTTMITTTTLSETNSSRNGAPSKYDFGHIIFFTESIVLQILYEYQRN